MSKTIICSTGTSAAKPLKRGNDLLQWVQEQGEVEKAADVLFSYIREILPIGDNLKNQLSAEIHSLFRINITSQDRILLLASSTDDGYCCALAVEKYLKHHWPGISVKTEPIEGLQVNDADLFRTTGVVKFVKRVIKEIAEFGPDSLILNPTGGYKALVPYMVLIGMLKGVKCRYIFEQSTVVLDLPPFPVEFGRSQFETYRNLFEEIMRETGISKTTWEQKIPHSERRWLEALFEFPGDQVTLSAVGLLFWDEIQTPSTLVPFLSKHAVCDCFDNLNKLDNCNPFRFLERVARSKDAFDKAEHINKKNGLRWLKPGNTTDRYLVSVEGWRMLVWRAIREDQEGSDYSTKVKVDPKTERQKYAPFMRMEYIT